MAVSRVCLLLSLVLLVSVGSSPLQAADNQNVLPNGSFEKSADGVPTGWRHESWAGSGKFEYVKAGRNDSQCVEISSTEGADIAWATNVPVKPNSHYKFTGYIKTENVETTTGRGAQFNIHSIQGAQTSAIGGNSDWTKVDMEFDTDANTEIQINCLFGGWGLATGKAFFDDLSLQLVSTRPINPEIEIDASVHKEPVSVYIYGQFIEHLGRCIYGGIWAEMLQDRKFYYTPGENRSPWTVTGDKESFTMDTKAPYVGDHTPQLNLNGKAVGIAQEGLGVVKGKQYTGRIILGAWDKSKDLADKLPLNLGSMLPEKGAGPVTVTLVWGDDEGDRQSVVIGKLKSKFVKYPLSFTAGASSDNAKLLIVAEGSGTIKIGTVSLMPADNIKGMRADTIKLLKQLNAPIYRWPGGNFVSGYDWRDGIGDRDRRPPRKNPAWRGVEHNDFGLDEFMTFCHEINTQPQIAVNTGFGDAHSAAEEVEYANGAADTYNGRWRAENGHSQPYGVTWWCVGNEMYGSWQLGHMALNQYVIKHNMVARAMRKVDPSIKLIGSGSVGPWSEGMLKNCSDYMDLISEHWYVQEKKDTLAHAQQTVHATRAKAEAHRRYRQEIPQLKGKNIRIALDEWNYWYGPHIYGELGTRYFHKDDLGIACGLNELIRNSDMFYMANYAQTVNVIGCIKTTKTAAAFATTALPLMLYRNHFGTIPVAIKGDAYPIDVVAALSADGKTLTIAAVNATEKPLDLPTKIKGATLKGGGTLWIIQNDDPMAYNEPGVAPKVVIKQATVTEITDKLKLPELSTSLYELPLQ